MRHTTDRITHTTAFVTPVVEHWLEREIAQWVHPMKLEFDPEACGKSMVGKPLTGQNMFSVLRTPNILIAIFTAIYKCMFCVKSTRGSDM